MSVYKATALAHPNIAFIKYWGNRDDTLRLPANGSISMNLAGLETHTTVVFDSSLASDQFTLNGFSQVGDALARVRSFLNLVRQMSGVKFCASVQSFNNFPTGAGIASSAAAFAALSLSATAAAGLSLTEAELSRLARRGSGSASRSVPGGFVEWHAGEDDLDSYSISFAPPNHWDLIDCVAIVASSHKHIGSSDGHRLASSSPLQAVRIASAQRRLEMCRSAIFDRDFEALASVTELDSNIMHAVMMTSNPMLIYWQPATLNVMVAIQEWRKGGLPCFFTIDAGPNVHVLCLFSSSNEVESRLLSILGVQQVIRAPAGGPAMLLP